MCVCCFQILQPQHQNFRYNAAWLIYSAVSFLYIAIIYKVLFPSRCRLNPTYQVLPGPTYSTSRVKSLIGIVQIMRLFCTQELLHSPSLYFLVSSFLPFFLEISLCKTSKSSIHVLSCKRERNDQHARVYFCEGGASVMSWSCDSRCVGVDEVGKTKIRRGGKFIVYL